MAEPAAGAALCAGVIRRHPGQDARRSVAIMADRNPARALNVVRRIEDDVRLHRAPDHNNRNRAACAGFNAARTGRFGLTVLGGVEAEMITNETLC
jgi:hypothetical protein